MRQAPAPGSGHMQSSLRVPRQVCLRCSVTGGHPTACGREGCGSGSSEAGPCTERRRKFSSTWPEAAAAACRQSGGSQRQRPSYGPQAQQWRRCCRAASTVRQRTGRAPASAPCIPSSSCHPTEAGSREGAAPQAPKAASLCQVPRGRQRGLASLGLAAALWLRGVGLRGWLARRRRQRPQFWQAACGQAEQGHRQQQRQAEQAAAQAGRCIAV